MIFLYFLLPVIYLCWVLSCPSLYQFWIQFFLVFPFCWGVVIKLFGNPLFYFEVVVTINLPFSTVFDLSHRFYYVLLAFSWVSINFLISFYFFHNLISCTALLKSCNVRHPANFFFFFCLFALVLNVNR